LTPDLSAKGRVTIHRAKGRNRAAGFEVAAEQGLLARGRDRQPGVLGR
jgi:hypothetical protein